MFPQENIQVYQAVYQFPYTAQYVQAPLEHQSYIYQEGQSFYAQPFENEVPNPPSILETVNVDRTSTLSGQLELSYQGNESDSVLKHPAAAVLQDDGDQVTSNSTLPQRNDAFYNSIYR